MKRLTATALAALLICAGLSAQNMRTGYFMDGYSYSYKMNPAMCATRGFFGIPVAGNFNLGVSTNLELSSILYPKADGSGLTTFLNAEVPADVALGKFGKFNPVDINTDLSLLSFGFWTGKDTKLFHTVELSLRADVSASLPYDLFRFAKEGSVNGNVFSLDHTTANVTSYMSLAYGISVPVLDFIRVGARAKLLMGIATADVNLGGSTIETSADKWAVRNGGTFMASLPLAVKFPLGEDGNYDFEGLGNNFGDPANYDFAAIPQSLGFAVDLGITVDFLENFTASVSVTDLGFISWDNCYYGEGIKGADGQPVEYVVMDRGAETDFAGLGEKMLETLKFKPAENGVAVRKIQMVNPTLYAGLEYRMPFYDRLSVGVLSTTKFAGTERTWTEGRFSINIEPANWFSFATNYAYSTFGHSAGAALSFHLPGINLFVGTDSYIPILNVTPQFVPIHSVTTSATVGLSFMFGKYNGRFAK